MKIGKDTKLKVKEGEFVDNESSEVHIQKLSQGETLVGVSVSVKFSFGFNSVSVSMWQSKVVPDESADMTQAAFYIKLKRDVVEAAKDALAEFSRFEEVRE